MIESLLSSSIARAVEAYRSRACPDVLELHGVRLLKTRRGRRQFHEFLREMGQVGAWPVFQVVEKRYFIAGKVVETFLDPYDNRHASWSFFRDVEAKQRLADFLAELPAEYLNDFARAYRTPDERALKESARRFSTLLRLKGDVMTARAVLCAVEVMSEIVAGEQRSNRHLPNRAMQSINLPTLVDFLAQVEDICRNSSLAQPS